MTKTKNIILGILILMILTNMISAISIEIEMKDSFNLGEEISFDYTITSPTNQEIEYVVSVNCPNSPVPLLEIKNTNLVANVLFKENYIYMSEVSDSIEPQICRAIVSILNPEISEEKNFSITTNPSFEFNFLTCKDEDCNEQTKVFVKNENIYFDYDSDIEGILTTAVLTYPNGNPQQLILPASIKAEQIGTYELKINASKQGYKTITKKIQFGVIEKEANIGYTSVSEIGNEKKNLSWVIILIGGVIVVIGILVYLIWRKRSMRTSF